MRRYIDILKAGVSALRFSATRGGSARAGWNGVLPERLQPLYQRGRDHMRTHGGSYLRHAPLFLALWSVRRAHPVILAYTIGKTGLGLAADPKIRAAVMAAAAKLRR